MAATAKRHAIVIGAGIGGLTTAIALRQAGIDATVFERAGEARQMQVGGGIHLWHNAMRAYQRLGLADTVQAVGAPVKRAEFCSWRGALLGSWPVEEVGHNLNAPAIGISRSDLLRALAEQLDDNIIRSGGQFTGYEQDTTGVTVRFVDGQEARGDLLIGADGMHSTVRAQVLGEAKPRYAGYTIWQGITDFEHEAAPHGLFRVLWGRGKRFAFYHVGDWRLYWFALANAPEGERDGPGVRDRLIERFHDWPELVTAVIAATDEREIGRLDIRDRKPVRRWGEGRVTLLGDAAHPMTFNVGQGACQAVEDAVVLAKCLRGPGDVATALRSYESCRIPRTATITNLAWRLGAIGRWEHALACAIRERIMTVAMSGFVLKQHEKDMAYEF